jgi:hypothetical protein
MKGCEVRFLFLNPTCESSRWTYGGNAAAFKDNVNTTIRNLKKLKLKYGDKLKANTIEYAPPIGIILVEKQKALTKKYFAHVQLYFLRGAIGANRPIFRVNYSDKWFQVFKKEFDDLWKESNNWDALNAHPTEIENG